ncbi:MAG: FAD-dependent monooxygenase [Hyphomicrobiaceae bacterium]|nr:FAD-dependent monooxygenase [Hyphomicrobiaceae bacterium]
MTNATQKALDGEPTRDVGSILIAGAGIGGLATALALAKRGIASTVLERRSAFEPEGAGIQIGPNGTRILAELGVADELEPLAGKPDAVHARNALSGASLARLPLGKWIEARHRAPYWVLHRQDLHAALLKSARESRIISIMTGFDVASAAMERDRVSIQDKGGRRLDGDALIAADGLRSHLRGELFDAPPLRFAGRSAARAVIPFEAMPEPLRENATTLWMSPRAHVVHYPVRGAREVAVIFVRKDTIASDDWSTAIPNAWVTDIAEGFAPILRELLETPPQWKKWALYELPPLPFWNLDRVALLGDAAHPTLPFMAQGAVLALEDAAVLARAVAERPADLPRALALYASARRHRASRVVAAAKSNGRIYHLDGMAAHARDATLRMAPPTMLMSRYDWIYGWRP